MLLEVRNLSVRYGQVHAVREVSLNINDGEIVAVLGANGAGKSSLLRALLGIEKAAGGKIIFEGKDITNWPASGRVRNGLALVPEGRRVIMTLTVHENLLMGAYNRRDGHNVAKEIEDIYRQFPNLAARKNAPASVLSGGEQQMLTIGRALLTAPKLMMLDEPSLGLSPRLAAEVFEHIKSLNSKKKLGLLLVEQNTQRALALADRAYVFELGNVVCEGTPELLLNDRTLLNAYLGQSKVKTDRPELHPPAS